MGEAIKKIAITTMLLGTVMIILTVLFGDSTITIMQKEQITESVYWYKIDFYSYFSNIGNQFKSIEKIWIELPSRTWQSLNTNPLDVDFWNALLNNMALGLDWIIFSINILLYPFRITFYLLQCILALVGVNTLEPTGGLEWLVNFNDFMANQVAIPYI